MSADTWTAIGSVGTLGGLILALAALRYGQRQDREGEGARLRALLDGYASRFSETVAILLDGSALIDPAWRAADDLVRRAEPDASAERVLALMSEHSIRLGIGVQAWVSSPVSGELRDSFRELAASTRQLTGRLTFLMPAWKIVESLVRSQDFPPLFLERLLDPDQGAEVTDEGRGVLQPEALSLQIGESLQSRGSTYFAVRYSEALTKLKDFVEMSVRALSALDSRTLTRIARLKSANDSASFSTWTAELEGRLEEISPLLSAADVSTMRDLVAQAGVLLEKESAAERLEALGSSD
ncbi:MAG TPA: hypothetical protein VK774_04375 [Solirubrobacteraceae bacterium]|nr:hypothetical protein [Solirubrobacteraceae bacterium]